MMMHIQALTAAACIMLAAPALAQRAEPDAAALAPALIACWQARGMNFTTDQVMARIGSRTGKAALQALAGATTSADGEDVETIVEITFEPGKRDSPYAPLMARDLERGQPLLLITTDGRVMLLIAMTQTILVATNSDGSGQFGLPISAAAIIGRPLVSGA